ncbi:nucleotidyltransferase domain-containing protein [Blautia obeum]|uniref:nucleotidyltransferase domain-containing protein n=1 Tax=Blautia obeum TaxID=40520 RepID=UPI003D04B57A
MSGEGIGKNRLTALQEEFLKILESFMHGKTYHLPEAFTQIEELYQMAGIHKMTAAVYEQIRGEALLQQPEYTNLARSFKGYTMREVMMQMQRADGFLRIYEKMCAQGVRPLVVKGIICRNLYEKSDYRVSGDEDILVRKEDFAVCDAILVAEGFQREEPDTEHLPQEIPYINPQNGVYIEMHFDLFAEESGAYGHLNKEFEDAYATCIAEDIQGRTVWTLHPTLHLFYLICHSLKHFLHGGFGIRQVCDMVMMAEHYGEQIDWDYIYGRLQELRMEVFWNGLVEIGREYLGFSYEKAHYPVSLQKMHVNCDHLLLDLLDSGIYGDSTAERKHSSNITLAAAESGKKDTVASMKASLFPGKDYMKRGYPWLERYPWLLPVAWGMRIVGYLKNKRKNSKEEPSGVEIGMNRVELLREYDIID